MSKKPPKKCRDCDNDADPGHALCPECQYKAKLQEMFRRMRDAGELITGDNADTLWEHIDA